MKYSTLRSAALLSAIIWLIAFILEGVYPESPTWVHVRSVSNFTFDMSILWMWAKLDKKARNGEIEEPA